MGPAAWAAVGRALGVALAASAFGGRNSLPAILAEEVQQAIARHDLEMAAAVLRDLAYRNRTVLDDFLKKYGDELPPEVKAEFATKG